MRSRPGSSLRAVLSVIVALSLTIGAAADAAPPEPEVAEPAAQPEPATQPEPAPPQPEPAPPQPEPAAQPESAPPPQASPEAPGRDVDKPFRIAAATMGVGGGLLIAGATSGVVMLLLGNEFREQRDESLELRLEVDCTNPEEGLCRRLGVRADAADRNLAKADVLELGLGAGLGAAGLVALIAGALVFALGTRETKRERGRLGISPQRMRGGGGLAFHGRF